LFIVVLFFTNLLVQLFIAPFVVGVFGLSVDQWGEVRGVIVFPVSIGATWLFYKLVVGKRNVEEGEEDACPECSLLAPDHLDTCTWQHADLR